MNANQIASNILATLKKAGVSDSDSRQILVLVAEKLAAEAQAERIAKATRIGVNTDEMDGLARGRAIGAALNKRMGYGQKGAK